MKNITNEIFICSKQVNNDTKTIIIAQKGSKIIFATEPKYLYLAVDSTGSTVDFMLSSKRDREAAKRFFKKALSFNHN